jgi:hypothetical protein
MAATSNPEDPFGVQSFSYAETAARIRELNERLIQNAAVEGKRRLDAYEEALTTLLELTEQAGAPQLEWASALAHMHAQFIRDVSATYTAMLRAQLG